MNARPLLSPPDLSSSKIRSASIWVAASILLTSSTLHAQSFSTSLPDAPSALLAEATASLPIDLAPDPSNPHVQVQTNRPLSHKQQQAADIAVASSLPPCPRNTRLMPIIFRPQSRSGHGCREQDQLQSIVDSGNLRPLTPRDKGTLALRATIDPFNLLTIAAFSGISIAADPHSVYGAGVGGWGRLAGYSFAEDIQGEFTGTFMLPVIFHQDPRYHRVPAKPLIRRIEHALVHTVISQHDDGSLMLNYSTLLNYPLSAEISNLYVPGLPTNAPSTAKRIAIGYATDPIGPLVAEFLPDLARHVHIHIVFAQQILNRIALGNNNAANSPL